MSSFPTRRSSDLIQVVVISNEGLGKSEARSTKIKIPEEEEEEEDEHEPDEEEENIPPVENLSSTYDQERNIIDVSWQYNGPPAVFKIIVNGQQKTVETNGIEIEGASPGNTYEITVIPIGTKGASEGVEGEARRTSQEIPAEPVEEPEPHQENDSEE